MSSFDRIKQLTKQLLPTGRALRMVNDGDKLIEAVAEGESRAFDDVISTLDAILADNANFTADDATAWEIRLGMIVSPNISLTDRKAAIIRKYNHPGTIQARQSADYIEGQLQAANFNGVFVHENVDNLTIEQILSIDVAIDQMGDSQMGDSQMGNAFTIFSDCLHKVQLGDSQMGGSQMGTTNWCDKIANHIDPLLDENFYVGENNRTFVIGGPIFGSFGTLDTDRIKEFRQLVLRMKPVNSVAYLLIDLI